MVEAAGILMALSLYPAEIYASDPESLLRDLAPGVSRQGPRSEASERTYGCGRIAQGHLDRPALHGLLRRRSTHDTFTLWC